MDRTERFGLILSPTEKNTLARLAEEAGGLSQAAMLRQLLREAARERGLLADDSQAVKSGEAARNGRKS